MPAENIGQQELRLPQVAPNRFAAEGSELALAGDWEVTTIVRAIGAFSWWSVATITVGETPPPAAVVNPAPIFGPAGVAGMIAVAIGLAALAAAVGRAGQRHRVEQVLPSPGWRRWPSVSSSLAMRGSRSRQKR